MKKHISTYIKRIAFFGGAVIFIQSCTYKDVVDTNVVYPNQTVYLSQAATATTAGGANGTYVINPKVVGFDYRFVVDAANNKFNIPLGVVKSSLDLSGAVNVSLSSNTDTITKLIALGKFIVPTDLTLTTEQLPSTAFTVPATASIADGVLGGTFTVGVDVNFLVNSFTNTPKKRYAFAVTMLSSDKGLVASALSTVVVFIDPAKVIPPTADFTSYPVTTSTSKGAGFINKSLNSVSYSWNYGDGSPVETTVSPTHTYAASGTYNVTLTTTGIAGSGPAVTKTTPITIP